MGHVRRKKKKKRKRGRGDVHGFNINDGLGADKGCCKAAGTSWSGERVMARDGDGRTPMGWDPCDEGKSGGETRGDDNAV